jgi:thiol-disulfide isomerase/thioredoxin
MIRFCVFIAAVLLAIQTATAQKGHNIRVKLDNYAEKELVLGFYFGDKTYVKDTVTLSADGYFTFKADTLLPCGVYLLVLRPDNSFIQILLDQNDQDFTVHTDTKEITGNMKIKGSSDNELFYNYLNFLGKLRPEADTLKAQLSRVKGNATDSTRIANQINAIDKKVKQYQDDLLTKNAASITAKIIRSSIEPAIPEFKGGTEIDIQRRRYYWYRAHYFDNIDLADPCFIRSPVLHGKVEYYVTKLAPQHPDSMASAVDFILDKAKNSKETFRYYVVHFLNYFAKSNLVGLDASYVHMAKKYYCQGDANWAKKEDVEKICDNARRLEPILIGKIAPNIIVKDRDNQPHALWDVNSDYTVLFFWAPDCGHCKKAAPHMIEFAEKFKDRGVKVFSVCTAVGEKAVTECMEGVKEKGFSDELFMNRLDPYILSRYKTLYDVQTTPQIFILDRKHEILMKRIGAEQLIKTMEDVMRMQEEKKKSQK